MNTIAEANCYACKGGGTIIGFGCNGAECACVAHCEACDEPVAWEYDDERAPALCAACACPATLRTGEALS